ncbi:MAG: EAL domain-containing protein [Betaproteobacteria bacterium]|nr:EAL domain-containing protein [Betaproteobacteria bacterium]
MNELMRGLGLDNQQIARRWDSFGFTEADVKRLRLLKEIVDTHADKLGDELYRLILGSDDSNSQLKNEEVIGTLRRYYVSYFKDLAEGEYGDKFVASRLSEIMAIQKVGLNPKLHVVAYRKLFSFFLELLPDHSGMTSAQLSDICNALMKAMMFDVALLFDSHALAEAQKPDLVAAHDELTGLPNRVVLQARVDKMISNAKSSGCLMACLFIDLDRFKSINYCLGDSFGDSVLQAIAINLQSAVKFTDVLAYHGADKFFLLLTDFQNLDQISAAAQNLLQRVARDHGLAGHEVSVTASIGISVYPSDGNDFETLIKNAELAKNHAREGGGNRYEFYSSEMGEALVRRLDLGEQLKLALRHNQLDLYYQPQVDLETGQIVGAEALLRWIHPKYGTVPPSEFIPIAEEIGLIGAIGEWVLFNACRQAVTWQREGLATLRIAVNLSTHQAINHDFLNVVRRVLDETSLDPTLLELELTESVLMLGVERTSEIFKSLVMLGIRLTVDDFSMGYSSISRLAHYPVSTIKIDRSFVHGITTDPNAAALVRSIIKLSQEMKLKVIAEGVETEGQAVYLAERGCYVVQGNLISQAIPSGEFHLLMKQFPGLAISKGSLKTPQRVILVVDDEPNIVTALKRLLRHDGYQIISASNGAEALELIAINSVQVIISDQRMPGMTGVEFLHRVKEIYPDTIRIVLSGYTELKSVTEAINEGAIYKFLTKPWEDEQLRAHVREAFRRYEMKEENIRLSEELEKAYEDLTELNLRLEEKVIEKTQMAQDNLHLLQISQELIEHLPIGLLCVDDDGLIVIANRQANAILDGYDQPLVGEEALLRIPQIFTEDAYRAGGKTAKLMLPNKRTVLVIYHRIGAFSLGSGVMLLLIPDDAKFVPTCT